MNDRALQIVVFSVLFMLDVCASKCALVLFEANA